ncbi:MAG: tRNA (N6-threonylcarbamoyladenosine(37)-N6)-methyltransferase TrmO [Anaerolineae bacterium]|nr:tRNA (N6-threonylcarbamoyladenosine(37)-N6)-methyltransferase TrmO [Anaerolineae bacterium]
MPDAHVIQYRPIGVLHTPFTDVAGMPIQPAGAAGVRGTAEIDPEFAPGLQDLEGFSHVIVLYHLHRASAPRLLVTPFMDTEPRGVFATRAPARPNPIGLSVVRLLGREGNVLHLENVDMLDGTPILDLKPYVPTFDGGTADRVGWLEHVQANVNTHQADWRFDEP